MTHAVANNLRGFRSSSLRVQVVRREAGLVWVRTADLLDVGTPLVLRAEQVVEETPAECGLRHRSGMVVMA